MIGDSTGRLKSWFDTHPVGFVIVRPDRYVAAAALAQHAPSVTAVPRHRHPPHLRRSP